MTETVLIKSDEFWVKVVEMLQQNWVHYSMNQRKQILQLLLLIKITYTSLQITPFINKFHYLYNNKYNTYQ